MARSPQEFLRFVAKHYRMLAAMCRENQRFTSDDEIESFVRPFADAGTNASWLMTRMKELGLVSQATGDWTPPPFLIRFLAELEQRHALASPGVVRGWVDKLDSLTQQLEALSSNGIPSGADSQLRLEDVLNETTDTLSTIAGTVAGNCDRIGADVAKYRAEEDARQMRFRLGRLIDLHTNYLDPVLRLVDIGGEFYSVSERIVNSCARLVNHLSPLSEHPICITAGTVVRDVTWLRRVTLRRAHEAHRELGPLCEAATRESHIARGVNRALEAIGAGDWAKLDLANTLQVLSLPDGPLINDRAASGYVLALRTFRDTPPPLLRAPEPSSMEVPWSAARVREELEGQNHVADILEWICDRVGRTAADTATGLLHDLIEAAPECLAVTGTHYRHYEFSEIDLQARTWSWNGEQDA